MCTSCRDRFELPVVGDGVCEICTTLQRLNRLVLTRHPNFEVDTLQQLLSRVVSKVETFIEGWETHKALGESLQRGVALGGKSIPTEKPNPPVDEVTGLRNLGRQLTQPKEKAWASKEPEGEEETDSPPRAASSKRKRSREKKEKTKAKEKKEEHREKRERSVKEDTHKDRKKRKERSEERRAEEEPAPREEESRPIREDSSDESDTREDRRSPKPRRDGETEEAAGENPEPPREPSRSPPGYRRERESHYHGRRQYSNTWYKKDKGQNHRDRGQVFRDTYGYDRGRDRGRGRGRSSYRRW